MSEGPTIGDWTQYGWIPDNASSFPARVRLRNAAWMVYYEPDVVVQRVQAENTMLRELVQGLWFAAQYLGMNPDGATGSGFARQMRELGMGVD